MQTFFFLIKIFYWKTLNLLAFISSAYLLSEMAAVTSLNSFSLKDFLVKETLHRGAAQEAAVLGKRKAAHPVLISLILPPETWLKRQSV